MEGKYFEYTIFEDGESLELRLTAQGCSEKEQLFEKYNTEGEDQYELFQRLTQDIQDTVGGFKAIHPSKVGHFFDGIIIGLHVELQGDDVIENDDSCYFVYQDHAIADLFKVLQEEGKANFVLAE